MNYINEEILIKRLEKEDLVVFEKLIQLFHEVFKSSWTASAKPSYLHGMLEQTTFIAIAALCKNEVIGGLTAHELPMYYKESSEIFIYDLAVSPDFRRKGTGKQLISALKKVNKDFWLSHPIEKSKFLLLAKFAYDISHDEDFAIKADDLL